MAPTALLVRRRAPPSALRDDRGRPGSRARGRARTSPTPARRCRGRAAFTHPWAFFGQIAPSGDFDVILFGWLGFGGLVWPEGWCGHEQNWAGYCSRLTTRDIEQVNRIVDPVQRARVLNAADAKLARAVPALPVVQPVLRAVISCVAPRLPSRRLAARVLAELGGLVARGVALAAALAVSLLAVCGSGRRSRADAEARRHHRPRYRRPRPLRSRPA